MKIRILFPALLLIFGIEGVQAQISVSNILEYRLGNMAHEVPTNLTTFYDQLNLSYYRSNISGDVRLEKFQAQNEQRAYAEITQRSVSLSESGFEVIIGNFYEIMGRGLLLRSYELPGVILEDFGIRTRYGFYRDIDGFLLKYRTNFLELKALRGKPLRNDLPPQPDFDDLRRPGVVEGVEANLLFWNGWSLGGAYLRSNRDEDFDGNNEYKEYGSVSFSGNLPYDFQVYTEYAMKLGEDHPIFDISDLSTHALYSSVNFIKGPVGMSFEFKDYNGFSFDFNDPPPLVKEHAFTLLNRSTHDLIAVNETGWQAEMVYVAPRGFTFTLNGTEAENKFHKKFLFKEIFAEVEYRLDGRTLLKGFLDRSEEPLKLERDRYTTGLYMEREWPKYLGTILDLEYQTFKRGTSENVRNYVTSLTLSQAPKFSAGFVWERSTDPAETDNPLTMEIETKARNWFGYNMSYQYKNKHFINLFYGKRRGGLACASGICYRVLDFVGLELRVSSVF